MISQLSCPVCHTRVRLEENKSMPFCSERCRLIDLGRWLEEEIGIPVSESEMEPDQDPPHEANSYG